MLKHISTLIDSGNPIWGMLTANEYYDGKHPLRNALRVKVQRMLDDAHRLAPDILQRVLGGARLQDFSYADQQLLRRFSRQKRAPPTARIPPQNLPMRNVAVRPSARILTRKRSYVRKLNIVRINAML